MRSRPLPESRYKYLYERLGDHNFQLLVNALLTERFTDFVPLPLRQADGGRDGITRGRIRSLVYQVKWSVNGREERVDWLDAVVKIESRQSEAAGQGGRAALRAGDQHPQHRESPTGTFDVLNERLDAHAKAYGLEEMSCLWREAVDGMVDRLLPRTCCGSTPTCSPAGS